MKCPIDQTELQERTVGPVKLDICPRCAGSWHDVDELRVLKDREAGGDYRWIDVELWRDPEQFRAPEQRGLPCPRDGARLTTMEYGETSVVVDACPTCHGIWLDRGEYEKIIEDLDRRVNTQSLGDYLSDLREEFLEVLSGPEGSLSEFKDLDRVLYLMQLRFAAEHPGIAAILRSLRL